MTLDIASRSRAYIVAEAGTCHAAGGDFRSFLAEDYVRAAAAAGADAVKFQLFTAPIRDDMFCWIEGDERRTPRWLQSDMHLRDWQRVAGLAHNYGIDFLASTFQYRTVAWLKELGVKATKVASRAAERFPYDEAVGDILVSNGLFKGAISAPPERTVIALQCEFKYPSSVRWEGVLPGYSAHSPTPDLAIDAIKRGAKVIETHFYIDPAHAGRDLPASLTLDGLRAVCAARDG